MAKMTLPLVAFLHVLAAQAPSAGLDGRWRSLETSTGGIGAMFEFRKDGTVAFSPGAVVEMSYRIEGDELVTPPATKSGPEQRQRIEWMGEDKLRLKSGDGPPIELARAGVRPDARRPILGEWVGAREMSGRKLETRLFLYPADKGLFLLPFSTQQGKYSVINGSIRLELPGRSPIEGKLLLVGDELTIPGPSGRESRFKRY